MLNEATHVDFHLLGLSTTSPPLTQPEQNTSDKNKSDDTTRNILHLEQAIQREEVSPSPTEAEPTNSIIAADHDNSDEVKTSSAKDYCSWARNGSTATNATASSTDTVRVSILTSIKWSKD